MKKISLAILIVLALASVASAQVTIAPAADVGIHSMKIVDSDNETTEKTSVTQVGLGVAADVGHGIVIGGSYGYGFGGELDTAGEVENHSVTTLNVNVRYTAYETGAVAIGPVVDYQSANWSYELGGDEEYFKTSGIGIGVFVTADLSPVTVSASYIHRLNAKLEEKVGGVESELEGSGYAVALSAAYPISDVLTLNGTYELDTRFSDDDKSLMFSGVKVGASYAF